MFVSLQLGAQESSVEFSAQLHINWEISVSPLGLIPRKFSDITQNFFSRCLPQHSSELFAGAPAPIQPKGGWRLTQCLRLGPINQYYTKCGLVANQLVRSNCRLLQILLSGKHARGLKIASSAKNPKKNRQNAFLEAPFMCFQISTALCCACLDHASDTIGWFWWEQILQG